LKFKVNGFDRFKAPDWKNPGAMENWPKEPNDFIPMVKNHFQPEDMGRPPEGWVNGILFPFVTKCLNSSSSKTL